MHDEQLLFGQMYSQDGVCYEGEVAWLKWECVNGSEGREEAYLDDEGRFTLGLPDLELAKATVSIAVVGAVVADLDPGGTRLMASDVTIVIEDSSVRGRR